MSATLLLARLAVVFLVMVTASIARAEDKRASRPPPRAAVPLAGWHNGVFFLRDPSDTFRLYPQGRVHVDGQAALGPGVSSLPAGSARTPTIFLRRARVEAAGELSRAQFLVQAEFAPTAIDNTAGRIATLECTPDATGAPRTCTERSAAIDAPAARPAIINAYVNYAADPMLNAQLGQFRVPFSMENRTGVNTLPFHDRALPVRIVAPPTGRDIGAMIWGETPGREIYYSVGLFNGDAADRTNVDRRFDVIGRTFIHPFAHARRGLRGISFGFSGKGGSRDPTLVGYDVPAMTTQSGFAFFGSTYRDGQQRLVHILPQGLQRAFGTEVYVPAGRLTVTAEYIHIDYGTREAADGLQLGGDGLRSGAISGDAWYAQIGLWLVGSRELLGKPGYMSPLHLSFAKVVPQPTHAVEIVARFEQLRLRYDASRRTGIDDPRTPSGRIAVDGVGFAVSYWATRHFRVSMNYLLYAFPGSAPITASRQGGAAQSAQQRAVAPAQLLTRGVDDAARDGGHSLHELSLRVAAQF